MLLGAITIYLMWKFSDLPTSGLVIFLVAGLGTLYTSLLIFWRGPISTWLAFVLVTLEGCLAPAILWSDASFDLTLARESSAAGVAFVAVALAGLRYRPWLVVYAGLIGGGLTAIGYPVFCPSGANDAIFCHPGLYWWRPIFLLLVAFAGALTVSAALRTFAVTERTIYEKEETGRLAAAKQLFLASVTHELRTPLNSILVLSRLLKESEEQTPKGKEQAEVIHNAGSSLLALINDILDLSKIEAGAMELSPKPTHLASFAEALELLFEPIAREKELAFVVRKVAGTPKEIVVDRLRLDQILRNLVGNALKFTEAGRVTVMIHPVDDGCLQRLLDQGRAGVIADSRDDYVAFSVRDTGLGINQQAQQQIFSAFVQADATTAQRFGGTGLGLSICAQLTKLMGGELGVESSEGLGATFTLLLPVAQLDAGSDTLLEEDVTLIEDAPSDLAEDLVEITNPGTAATTRIRGEVLRSVALTNISPAAATAEESSTSVGQLWASPATEESSRTTPGTYHDKRAVIAHEDILTNYRAASALEALGLEVVSRTSEAEVSPILQRSVPPDLLLVSPDLAHLAAATTAPTILICHDEQAEPPLPDGIADVLFAPVDGLRLKALLDAHLAGGET